MEEDVDNDILSPDGKWMWTGSKWIPAPPTSSQSANVNLQELKPLEQPKHIVSMYLTRQ